MQTGMLLFSCHMPRFPSRKRLFAIHGWLGLNLGLLLYAICLSGTLAVFTPEIDWLMDPVRAVSPSADMERASWGEIEAVVRRAYPHALIRGYLRGDHARAADSVLIHHPPADTRIIFVDPYRRIVTGQRTFLDLKSFLRIFHKQFYLVPTTIGFHGTFLVGVFALVLLGSVLTGLFVFKHWWRALFRIRTGGGRRLFWSDIHRSAGAWALLVTLILAITGLWYWTEKILDSAGMADHDEPAPRVLIDKLENSGAVQRMLPLDVLVEKARKAYPGLSIDALWAPAHPDETLLVEGQGRAFAVRSRANRVSIDPFGGHILQVRRAEMLPLGERLMHMADPLHFGTFGGWMSRVIWFIAGLVITVGILAGAYIQWARTTRFRDRRQTGISSAWKVSLGLTTMLIFLSAISCVAYIREGQISHSLETVQLLPDGKIDFGDVEMLLFREELPSEGRQSLSLRLEEGIGFRVTQAEFFPPDEDEEQTESIPARVLMDRIVGKIPVNQDPEIKLEGFKVRLSRPDRSLVTGEWHPLDPGDEKWWKGMGPTPPRPEVPPYIYAGIGIFAILLVLPAGLWYFHLRW